MLSTRTQASSQRSGRVILLLFAAAAVADATVAAAVPAAAVPTVAAAAVPTVADWILFSALFV